MITERNLRKQISALNLFISSQSKNHFLWILLFGLKKFNKGFIFIIDYSDNVIQSTFHYVHIYWIKIVCPVNTLSILLLRKTRSNGYTKGDCLFSLCHSLRKLYWSLESTKNGNNANKITFYLNVNFSPVKHRIHVCCPLKKVQKM